MYKETKEKLKQLENSLIDPKITSDTQKLAEISREYKELKELAELEEKIEKTKKQLTENTEIIRQNDDAVLCELAQEEIKILEPELKKLQKKLELKLKPADPLDKKNVIMEIRAGTGGDESALFAAELFRMYSRYAEVNKWKVNILTSNRIGLGGFKEIVFEILGQNVYKYLKYEAGTHRVQRVPETEKQGRVHTSAATVAVLPEVKKVDIEIKNEDLRIDTYSASGPGGQSVNTSNSAVRITHIPTDTVVQCQDQKDQHQNKEKALQILRSRVVAKVEEDKRKKEAVKRKTQIGTGDRSEKIRTYNFPQDRISDHRIKKNWSNIQTILDGDLGSIIQALQKTK